MKLSPQLQNAVSDIKPIDIRAELFKKGDFDFICAGKAINSEIVPKGQFTKHMKQEQALKILTSNKYKEFLYGGAAGGSKSWTGVSWIMFMSICYPGTKWFIAREELKDITDSVLVTWGKVAQEYGFSDWKFNAVKNFIQLGNGSHINLIEIKYKPSDPNFDDLGSTEYTGGWIEEVAQTHPKAATTLRSRVGRHLNDKYGIKGMVFYTCNPTKNWAKTKFYDKSLKGTLESNRAFLQCLVVENPFIEQDYINDLREMAADDEAAYNRLFKGDWEYDDNPNKLCEQQMIEQVFDNDHVEDGRKYITADVARLGSDKARIAVWSGWKVIDHISFPISKTTEISNAINLFRRKYGIPKNQCVADEDGVGGGVVDETGILGFKNGSSPIKESGVSKKGKTDTPQYRNLQVQCLYHLADKINQGGIWINCDLTNEQKEELKQELGQIQSKLSDWGKLDVKPKSEIKRDIGRSPDWRDLLLMRVYFDLKPTKKRFVIGRPKTF